MARASGLPASFTHRRYKGFQFAGDDLENVPLNTVAACKTRTAKPAREGDKGAFADIVEVHDVPPRPGGDVVPGGLLAEIAVLSTESLIGSQGEAGHLGFPHIRNLRIMSYTSPEFHAIQKFSFNHDIMLCVYGYKYETSWKRYPDSKCL